MLNKLIVVLLCTFSCANFVTANEEQVFKEERFAQLPGIMYIDNFYPKEEIVSQADFFNREFLAMTLEKGSTFYVKSLQPMSSDTPKGARIEFEADTKLFSDSKISRVVFTGEVIENKPPRLAGRSGTLKLQLIKMKVDNVTYPTKAFISRMGNKMVMGGVLAGMPNYFSNLADVAEKGTVTIDKVYMDPCQFHNCEAIVAPLRPCYYLGGAFLQLVDLCAAPIISIFRRGEEINIPENSSFEIKLADHMSLLRLDM